MRLFRLWCVALVAAISVDRSAAWAASLFSDPGTGRALIEFDRPDQDSGPSLFAGGRVGLFSPIVQAVAMGPRFAGPAVEGLRHLIGQAESRHRRYDAVQHGARIPPEKPPTQMTLAEIFDWIDRTPGQPHAIGRYQFIPDTLRRVVARVGAPPDARFTPQLQDRLADVLLAEAGLNAMKSGQMDRVTFMNNLARIWAGLPNSTGRSHYHGYAGNKATMSWARFEAEMKRIFPG